MPGPGRSQSDPSLPWEPSGAGGILDDSRRLSPFLLGCSNTSFYLSSLLLGLKGGVWGGGYDKNDVFKFLVYKVKRPSASGVHTHFWVRFQYTHVSAFNVGQLQSSDSSIISSKMSELFLGLT